MKSRDMDNLLDDKLSSISEKLDILSEKVSNSATKDDLRELSKKVSTKKDLKKMENRLVKRFDSMDKGLDQDLAETMQRVKHIENHIDIPPFTPISPN